MQRIDVLIVGAGVIGLSCALELLRAGRHVVVIDAGRVGGGSSHGNCGTITPSHATPLAAPGMLGQALRWMLQPDAPLYVKPRLDAALARWLLHFATRCNARDYRASAAAKAVLLNASRALLEENIRREKLDCEFSTQGSIYVYRNPAALDAAHLMTDTLRRYGVQAQTLDAVTLAREEPALREGMAGGVLFPGDAALRPDRLVAELARRVRELGGRIVEHACMETVARTHDGRVERVVVRCTAPVDVRSVSADGAIGSMHVPHAVQTEDAKKILQPTQAAGAPSDEVAPPGTDRIDWAPAEVVLATGAWSPRFAAQLGLRIPIQPGKGYSITYSLPARVPRRPLVLRERSVCVTAWGSGFRLGSTMEFSGYDATLNRTRLAALPRGAAEYLRDPAGPEKREEWFGWRPMTWDDLPLLGRVPGASNLLLATGHGMLGVSMSAITGRVIADLVIAREAVLDLAPYSPARFS